MEKASTHRVDPNGVLFVVLPNDDGLVDGRRDEDQWLAAILGPRLELDRVDPVLVTIKHALEIHRVLDVFVKSP